MAGVSRLLAQGGHAIFSCNLRGFRPETRKLARAGVVLEDITAQTEQVMQNLGAVLEAAGTSFQRTVKTLCFLQTMDDFAAFNEVYARYFTEKPARSCVAVRTLPKGVLVEVEAIAEL